MGDGVKMRSTYERLTRIHFSFERRDVERLLIAAAKAQRDSGPGSWVVEFDEDHSAEVIWERRTPDTSMEEKEKGDGAAR